ncbi:MAG: peptidoglycan DD-metalloendopeptidase family protein [Chloroflexota bacterium]
MSEDSNSGSNSGIPQPEIENNLSPSRESKPNIFLALVELLAKMGLGELATRIGTNVLSVLLIIGIVLIMQSFIRQTSAAMEGMEPIVNTSPIANQIPLISTDPLAPDGIARNAILHTTIPSRPRVEVIAYTVQVGDSVFKIAESFGLNPKTVLWGNYAILRDDPHRLRPDQVLNILPINGTYYEWQGTESLITVAGYFGVNPEMVINYPGNHLDPDAIGDLSAPNIPAGTWLIVPGGAREFTSWGAPVGVTRDNPAVARVIGVGACGAISGGAIGYGTFVWPASQHRLSGYDYSPDSNHPAIDIAGNTGDSVFAVDAGVIVYAGWNDYGYGNLIMIDHGNGWQSLYAHLNTINIVCSQSVGQGEFIGTIGSTGNSTGSHLHFELMHTQYGKINPWNFLP